MEDTFQTPQKLSRRALRLMRLTSGIRMLILFALFCAARTGLCALELPTAGTVVLCVGAGYCLLDFLLLPQLRYRRYRYLLAQDRLEISEGVLFQKRTVVPVDRIHQIEISSGPLDRLCKLARVEVTTAGGTAVLGFLEQEQAEAVAKGLHTRLKEKLSRPGEADDV